MPPTRCSNGSPLQCLINSKEPPQRPQHSSIFPINSLRLRAILTSRFTHMNPSVANWPPLPPSIHRNPSPPPPSRPHFVHARRPPTRTRGDEQAEFLYVGRKKNVILTTLSLVRPLTLKGCSGQSIPAHPRCADGHTPGKVRPLVDGSGKRKRRAEKARDPYVGWWLPRYDHHRHHHHYFSCKNELARRM